ncbi:hemolysin [Pseudoalteromonas sp. S1609]|uniref:choice-of-anchor A family protein n=1 Tax=Pseudoalteromonas sp. S1609 TaxID=579505 RepID=UPI00110BFA00|nr:choice-of-anchor A family protein [Pseudoalteromonas sp. S1609]TMP70799.1 hemolysin [Pseudoalteromonas sp. S1609]
MTNSLLKFKKLSAVIALALASSSTLAADLGVANNFSAFVFDDFKSNIGRADGAIAAGKIDIKGYSVGFLRPSNPNEYYLISESSIDYKIGRQFVGSMIAGGGTDVSWSVRWGMERGTEIASNQDESTMPFNFDKQEQYYKDLSAELGKLDATGTVQSKWGGLYLEGDGSSDTQVFNLDARQFAKAHTFKVWGIPADATVIFNITGDDELNVKGKSFWRLRNHATKTVFNFTNAEKLNIKGNRWQGVVLAPYADIRGVYGTAKMPVIGQSFYGSMALLGGEFNGNLPKAAEPIAPFAMEKKWSWNSSDFMPEFDQVISTPVVGQLNDDNKDGKIDEKDVADIVISTYSNKLYINPGIVRALDGRDGSELWSYEQGAIYTDPRNSIALGDVDGDGIVDLIVNDHTSGTVDIISNKGELKKSLEKETKLLGAVNISDINNDGSVEIIIGRNVFNYDSGYLFNTNFGAGAITLDSDNDGSQEVFSGGGMYKNDGTLLWQQGEPGKAWFSSVADFDNDSKPDILVTAPSNEATPSMGSISLLDNSGNVIWTKTDLSNPGGGVQSIGNFFSRDELGIVSSGYNSVQMRNSIGDIIWSSSHDDSLSGRIGLSSFDFNSDGLEEVVTMDHFEVRILDGKTGGVLASAPNSTSTLWEYPIVVDLEGDDNAELIVVSNNSDERYSINNGVTVFGAADNSKPWKNATRIWNQHSYHQTNINQNGTVPTAELPSWLNNNTYRSGTLK